MSHLPDTVAESYCFTLFFLSILFLYSGLQSSYSKIPNSHCLFFFKFKITFTFTVDGFEKTIRLFEVFFLFYIMLYIPLQIKYIFVNVNKLGENENDQYKWLPASKDPMQIKWLITHSSFEDQSLNLAWQKTRIKKDKYIAIIIFIKLWLWDYI